VDRWDAVHNALLDPADGVITQLESVVRFGLELYTSHNGWDYGGTCPEMIGVAPAMDNYVAIDDLYDANSPQEDTPTGEAIDYVVASLDADSAPGNKIIVLATDGEPDTCEVPDPQTGQDESVAAAAAALAAGYPVYIIAVGDDVGQAHQEDMAIAGGGPGAVPYPANNPNALVNAFEEIIYGVRECVLTLNGEVVAGMEDQCTVKIDDQDVPYDHPDGWQLQSPSQVELLGDSCTAIQEGLVQIDVWCPCDAIILV
jgi:hypothetical protein